MNYKAQIFKNWTYQDISLTATNQNEAVLELKKLAGIDLRKHSRQTFISEFNPSRWGVFFHEPKSGRLLAFVEFTEEV